MLCDICGTISDVSYVFFFFQAEDGIRDWSVTGVQTCALPIFYNRGVVNAMLSVEAIRTAMTKHGNKPLTGAEVRWGFENLNLTEPRLEQLGMKGFTHPVKVTCEDHEGAGPVMFEQWDGKKWNIVSDWIPVMRDVVRPKLEAAAVEEGKKLSYTERDCAKEK